MLSLPKAFDLSQHVALVTGGAGLLGREHALALGALGAKVFVADLDPKRTLEVCSELKRAEENGTYVPLKMDVTSELSIREARETIFKESHHLDILVNNAAIDPKVKSGDEKDLLEGSRFENFSLEDWNFQMNVGLTGAFLVSKAFVPFMAKRGQGVILNISSDLSVFAPDQRIYRKAHLPDDQQPVKPVTYSVIKTGLIGLTRYLAGYYAAQGVRVNALSPGGIANGQNPEFVTKLTDLIPMGRMAQRDEYRSAVQFLCSEASKYMTGQNIVMDGGRSVL